MPYFLLILLFLSDHFFFLAFLLHLELVLTIFLLVLFYLLISLSLFISNALVESQVHSCILKFLSDSLQILSGCDVHGSIPFIVLVVEEELFVDRCQQRILLYFLEDGDYEVSFVVFHSQNKAGVAFLVILFRVIDS